LTGGSVDTASTDGDARRNIHDSRYQERQMTEQEPTEKASHPVDEQEAPEEQVEDLEPGEEDTAELKGGKWHDLFGPGSE